MTSFIEDIQYQIQVMQAYKDGARIMQKHRKYPFREGCEVCQPEWDWVNYIYYVKKEESKTHKDVVLDKLVILHALRGEHETNPDLAVNDLIQMEVTIALDPLVSERARVLQNRIPSWLNGIPVTLDPREIGEDKMTELMAKAKFPCFMIFLPNASMVKAMHRQVSSFQEWMNLTNFTNHYRVTVRF